MREKVEIMEANAREVHVIEYLACLDARLVEGQTVLEKRLRTIPNGWRNFRLALTTVEKLLMQVYDTLPDKTLRHMDRVHQCGEVIIRPRPAIKMPDDVQIVMTDDLRLIINTMIKHECAMCIKDAREQKKCKLRKALMDIAPPHELNENGLCNYIDVVAANEYGDYV
jgi:hypothetical protein